MKRETNNGLTNSLISPYSLRRTNTVRKTTLTKLNNGIVINNKNKNNTPKLSSLKMKLKKNFILIITILCILYIYYLYLFVSK